MSIQFSTAFLDQIRTRVSLSGIISRKTKLVRAGKLFKGPCPFHNEKTPSFVVYEDQGTYHCFGCSAHGDAITFLTTLEGYSFPEAVRLLAEQAGLPLPQEEVYQADKKPALPLRECLEAAAKWFEMQLHYPAGEQARRYLDKRKLTIEIIRQFRLGFAPAGNRLKDHLLKAGFDQLTMKDAGLLIVPENNSDSYDRFRERIIFPICDRQGRVIGFGGRILGAGEPKYLNSPETALFHKGHELYGFHIARHVDLKELPLIVCEGYTDVLAFHQAGFKGAVASLGTALTENQIELLWRRSHEPILCFDGDKAGQRAAYKAAEKTLSILRPGVTLDFVAMPTGDDPASLVEKNQLDVLAKSLQNKKGLADILWEKETADQSFQTPDQKTLLQKNLLDYAGQIKDFTLQNFYKGYFRNKLFEFLRKPSSKKTTTTLDRPRINAHERQQEILLATIINHPEILHEVFEAFSLLEFSRSQHEEAQQIILEKFNLHSALDSCQLQHHLCEKGYKYLSENLNAGINLHAPFAALNATKDQALKGWWSTWNLTQTRQSQADESQLLRTGFSQEMSTEYWEKIRKLRAAQLFQAEPETFEI